MTIKINILKEIKSKWIDKSTGVLFFKLDNGRLLRVFMVAGEVQSLNYHGCRGIDILKKIQKMVVVSYQFHPDAVSRMEEELPPTSDIINMEDNSLFDSGGDVLACQSGFLIGNHKKVIIESILIEYVGPIADVIFSEELIKSKSVQQLIQNIAHQIDGRDNQLNFKRDVTRAIKD